MEIIGYEFLEENIGWEICKGLGAPFPLSGKGEKNDSQSCAALHSPGSPILPAPVIGSLDYYFTVPGVIKIAGEFHLEPWS